MLLRGDRPHRRELRGGGHRPQGLEARRREGGGGDDEPRGGRREHEHQHGAHVAERQEVSDFGGPFRLRLHVVREHILDVHLLRRADDQLHFGLRLGPLCEVDEERLRGGRRAAVGSAGQDGGGKRHAVLRHAEGPPAVVLRLLGRPHRPQEADCAGPQHVRAGPGDPRGGRRDGRKPVCWLRSGRLLPGLRHGRHVHQQPGGRVRPLRPLLALVGAGLLPLLA
mmetsp:Transcript_30829/g.94823  ORF Transcript_30829/g.94823 Transcript_30829/m.94823 type:complete len:224 (+) Transcript_30829:772-1443(+)